MKHSIQSQVRIGIVAALTAVSVTGCSDKDRVVEAKQAPVLISESFQAASNCKQASCITIQKESLGKIFLLISSGVTGGSTPQWYDLKPQVVSFERSGKKIALLGQNYNSIYSEIQSVNLIQTFEIISEDEKSITFDWGGGLKTFVAQGAYDVDAARGGNNDLTETSVNSIPVSDSFIRKIKFDDKNIELEQVSKIPSSLVKKSKDNLSVETREETVVMNVQIRSYDLHPEFTSKEYDSSRRVGFFVNKVARKSVSKDVKNLISKWDLSDSRGPIRVRVSATVPEDYVQAVVEGALYWNKVFGKDIIKVETGVKVEDAGPQDRSIMIRWINWVDAGAAYAISQSDPLTGEIFRAQVFMPSVFTKVGSADLVSLNGKKPVNVLNGAIACDFTKTFNDVNMLAREATDSQRLRLAKDSVRSTVAHELGHAFGLRHNFAGSFSTKVTTQDIGNASKTYLNDLKHEGLETSTSIMDYVSGIDNILMAAKIKYAPLSYDKMAMDWAYSKNGAQLDESISLYCTDDDIALANSYGMSVYGCERFDAGRNPLERKYLVAKNEKENLVNVLFASIIGRMYPGDQPEVVNDLEKVIRDTVRFGKADMSALAFIGNALYDKTKNSIPAGAFVSLDNVKTGTIASAKSGKDVFWNKRRKQDVAAVGGYAGILNGLLRDASGAIDVRWFDAQVDALAASDFLKKGKTLAGRQYELTEIQKNKIIEFFRRLAEANKNTIFGGLQNLFPKLNEAEEQEDGKVLLVTSTLAAEMLDQDQADKLAQISLDLLALNSNETAAVVTLQDGTKINLPERFYSASERLSVLKLLSTKGLSFNMDLNKARVKNTEFTLVNDLIKKITNIDVTTLTVEQRKSLPKEMLTKGLISEDAKVWFEEEFSILAGLES